MTDARNIDIDELRAKLRTDTGLMIEDEHLASEVTEGLVAVEALLRKSAESNAKSVHEAACHLVHAGGKRFRPMYTLLAAQFGTGSSAPVITAATVVELVHLATLYHDDVMDDATMRRGTESANARWGNKIAILTGDLLFAEASTLAAELGAEATAAIAETLRELATGQLRETMGPQNHEDPIAHYLSVIEQKTGSLIATAGYFGATFSSASKEIALALQEFGATIGAAFQISDDILDVDSPSNQLGKARGTDLRGGVQTLPILYALHQTEPTSRLTELVSGPITDDRLVDEAIRLLHDSGALERARTTLADYAHRARATLTVLPSSPARKACESIADYVVARTY